MTREFDSKNYDVAGMGNAIVDVLASVDDNFLLTHEIAKGAMTLIDAFRAEQLQKALAAIPGGTREVAGGSAGNTMAGIASLGGTGIYVGKVKNDRLGNVFGASLKDLGISFSTRRATEGPSTASCTIAVTGEGERSMSTYLGACRELTPDDIDEAALAGAKALYIEGYLWDTDSAKDASRKAIAAVKRAGGKIAFTMSDSFCVGRFRDEFLALMKGDLDIVFANEEEAKALFMAEKWDGVLRAAKAWGGIIAITRSAKGCVVIKGDEVHTIPAAPVARVIDTTGAGDQYAAGFLYALTHDRGLDDCGRFGSLAAAEVISHFGARPETSLKELAAKAGL